MLALAALLLAPRVAHAQVFADDFNPGTDGSVVAIAPLPDGKVIVAGDFITAGGGGFGTTQMPRVARVNADGSLDTTFDIRADGFDYVTAMAVQPDGKVLVGGWVSSVRLVRMNPDGTFDGFDSGTDGDIRAFLVQADGRILVGGSFGFLGRGQFGDQSRPFFGRLSADGAAEAFAQDLLLDNEVLAIAQQPDGKVLLGGRFTTVHNGSTQRRHLLRLNSNGTLDASFNPGANGVVSAITVQPDGGILVGGQFSMLGGGTGTTTRHRIGRILSNGNVDAGYDPGADGDVLAIALQTDGRVVVGGSFSTIGGGGTGTALRRRIARLEANGAVDMVFDPGTEMGSSVATLKIQSDGRILVAGAFRAAGGRRRSNVVRLLPQLPPAIPPLRTYTEQQPKLSSLPVTLSESQQGAALALSGDGNVAAVGHPGFIGGQGGVTLWKRTGTTWAVASGSFGVTTGPNRQQGRLVAMAGDANTLLSAGTTGAYVWTWSAGVWGAPTFLEGGAGFQFGGGLALSADGNTLALGAPAEDPPGTEPASEFIGVVRVWTRTGGAWSGPVFVHLPWARNQGRALALSGDGRTMLIGGDFDGRPNVWVVTKNATGQWTRTFPPLAAAGEEGTCRGLGSSTALSSDGATAIVVSGCDNDGAGAAWVWTRNAAGQWTQQGSKLVPAGNSEGFSGPVALSANGDVAVIGGNAGGGGSGFPGRGAWIWMRRNGEWMLQPKKLLGNTQAGDAAQGLAVALSADGVTALVGGPADDGNKGAAWAFSIAAPAVVTGAATSVTATTAVFNATAALTRVFNRRLGELLQFGAAVTTSEWATRQATVPSASMANVSSSDWTRTCARRGDPSNARIGVADRCSHRSSPLSTSRAKV